jgi:predicted transposase YbfD/YdcC
MNRATNSFYVIFDPFSDLSDWRREQGKRHTFNDILVIALCAIVSGADDCEEIVDFGLANEEWFRGFLSLPNGIPSQDTFLRFFAHVNPDKFRLAFIQWVESFGKCVSGKQIAVDGKTLRRSFNKASGKLGIHMVSAWCHETGMVLGQVKTDVKSNEITAVPKLIKLLDIRGATVSGDAMNCQKKIVKTIIEGKGDYVIQVKDNQPTMREEIELYFKTEAGTSLKQDKNTYFHTLEKGHGRIEERTYWHTNDVCWFHDLKKWAGLGGFGMMQSQVTNLTTNKTSTENHFYITSIKDPDVERFAKVARGQWTIETQLHWRLDVAFNEDQSRLRKGNAAENYAIMRHMAINLLQQVPRKPKSVKRFRKRCGWDRDFLLQVLGIKHDE